MHHRLLLIAALFFSSIATAFADQSDWIVTDSPHSVQDTVARLENLIEQAPPSLIARIDHGANAEKAGMSLGESVLLIFGAPKVGTPIMQSNRLAGLLLPARILVFDDNGSTRMAYIDPAMIAREFQADAADEQLGKMSQLLNRLVTKAAE